MKPALSVIVFTVLSGAGLGLLILVALAQLIGWGGGLSDRVHLIAGLSALVLLTAGLLSSVLHLANPKNGWRAWRQFRYSWLSREAVFALLLYPIGLAYLTLAAVPLSGAARDVAGALTVLLAVVVLWCTGMIYACLKTIPRWHTWLTPVGYLALGAFSGSLALLAFAAADGAAMPPFALVALLLLILGAAIKAQYFHRFRAPADGAHTLGQALGVTAAQVKLLDAGHTRRTFLTEEFMFRVGRARAQALRYVFATATFVMPLGVIALGLAAGFWTAWLLWLAFAAALAGLLVERWLFFAEAEHVVRLYHGQQRV